MKAGPIVLAITFAVILVLPDTYGAPSCADSKSDVVLSEKVEKESSKSSDTSAQEQKVDKETQSKCSNGLASGSKSSSESRDLKHSEEEQSRSATERKTATGTERVEESLKKKKVVTVSEKKNVLVYYMVSYKKLPAKGKDECEEAYYKRIFPKEDNLHVFYRKIFKAYEGEAPAAYINRIEFIMGRVYPDLDCRLDVKWLEQFDHYYTLKYSRKLNEPDNQYYHRILEKEEGETCEHYQKRMECLVAALDEEDFSHISFDYSNLSYNIGVRKTPAKSYSSPSSSGQKIGEEVTSSKKSTENAESLDESESSVEQKSQKGSSSQHQKNLKKKKVSVEKEEQTKSATYRMAYSKLPERKPGVDLSSYYKSFFGSCGSSLSEQAASDLYLRVLMQYKGESCKDYVKRIDYICDNVYPHLDIRTNQGFTNLLEHYYRVKYEKLKDETEEKWYDRVLCKVKGETPEHYKSRVSCLQSCLKEINWSRITIDPNSSTGYSLVSSLGKVGQVTKVGGGLLGGLLTGVIKHKVGTVKAGVGIVKAGVGAAKGNVQFKPLHQVLGIKGGAGVGVRTLGGVIGGVAAPGGVVGCATGAGTTGVGTTTLGRVVGGAAATGGVATGCATGAQAAGTRLAYRQVGLFGRRRGC